MPGAAWITTTGSTLMNTGTSTSTTSTVAYYHLREGFVYRVEYPAGYWPLGTTWGGTVWGEAFTWGDGLARPGPSRPQRPGRADLDEEEAREREERERERTEERARFTAACERARATFVSFLDEENRERFEHQGFVIVTGSAGGRYRIRQGYAGNVDQLSPGRIQRYCAHPPMRYNNGRLPEADAMITQMFKLLTDEPGFLEIANVV